MQTTPRRADATPTGPPAASPFFRYRFANVEFDESLGTLSVAGSAVDIEPRPRELLSELLRRPNEVVAREELLETLWQGRPTVDNVLANAVTKLRKALGPEGAERLLNVPRVGYRLAGPIERVAVGQHAGDLPIFVAGDPVPGRLAYRLEAPLGRSAATALVWRARDPKLQETRVFKFAADGERLTALKREYTLYRVLRAELGERDDFARVLGANFATAPYFIECEDGGPDLLAWAEEGDRLANLSTGERLSLFLKIARAVAAAHRVGVLHKDLKPANVLVGSDIAGWVAKLTDFGSSRLLDPGRLAALGITAMGLTVTHGIGSDSPGGTPLYLAPELIAGRSPTTQSDLYALGLMLYQMVVGDLRRPMSTGWQREIDESLLAGDIAAATEGRPEDRLGSVAALVERLETLEARRLAATEAAEAARWAEALLADADRRRARRPWVVGAVGALSIGLATSLWFYIEARGALQTAQQESARANAINDFLTKDVLQSKDLIRAGTKKPTILLDVLRQASAQVSVRFKDQPLSEAAVRLQLGKTFTRLANSNEAWREFDKALALATPRLKPDDPLVLAIHLAYADFHLRTTEPKEEADVGSKEIDDVLRTAGPKILQSRTELAFLLARADFERLRRFDRNQEARAPGERMVALADSVPSIDPETRFEARQSLAELYLFLGEPAKADALFAGLMSLPAGESDAAEVAYARAALALADSHRRADKETQAEAELQALSDRLQRTLGRDNLQYATARNELARIYNDRGDARRCLQFLQEAREAYAAVLGTEHQAVKITESNMALQLVLLDRHAEALQLVDRIEPWFVLHRTRRWWPLDEARLGALVGLGRAREALAAFAALPPDEQAADSDMRPKLDALRGRALIDIGDKPQGIALLASGVDALTKKGEDGVALNHYRQWLAEARGGRR